MGLEVNGASQAQQIITLDGDSKIKNQKVDQQNCIFDNTNKNGEVPPEKLSERNKREWIEAYMGEHNCSKKDAKAAFEAQFEKIDKMSPKDAKNWVKDYMEQTGCSKIEANLAFEDEFGYTRPRSIGSKIAVAPLAGLLSLSGPFGVIPALLAQFLNERILNNGDAEYIAKE